jgi:flagellar basal-body rod protein FlgB
LVGAHKPGANESSYSVVTIKRTGATMNLFVLATQHRSWLGLRQAAVAQNIANANTPGYKAHGVLEFGRALKLEAVVPAATHQAHFSGEGQKIARSLEAAEPDGVTHSGNSVVVERELLAAGEINRSYALNVSVVKTFHRLLMASVRT